MKNYSYVTLLTNDSYVCGVALLVQSMKEVNTKYPLHALIIDEVTAAAREILDQLHVTYEVVDVIETPKGIYDYNYSRAPAIAATWRNCWTKFRIFDQTQFDKIVFLDADVMVTKNLDHLFDLPHLTSALDGEYFDLWQGQPHLNAGCIVIEPSHEEFLNLLDFANSIDSENPPDVPGDCIADQEVINLYFKDWPDKPELHLNKYYDIFAPYTQDSQLEDLKANTYFVHYVGRKPWTFWLRTETDMYSEYYYSLGKAKVEQCFENIDWQKVANKVVLTVYGICKNERQNIEKYLDSFGEADYVCLLDTGSTDGTWEYLQEAKKKYPNLIIDQKEITPWRFDRARNESMKLLPKETCMYFMADIDEVIKEKGWSKVVKNAWTPIFDRGMYTYNRDVGLNDVVTKKMQEYRIHSKDWYKWINIVHEALINYKGNKQFFIETCTPIDITVWHYPTKVGQTNYMELCEKDLAEYPDDWVMRLQLAIEYELRDEWDKAKYHFEYAITHENKLQAYELARCYFGMGRICLLHDEIPQALYWFAQGRVICPDYADNYLAAAEIYYNHKRFNETIDLCKTAFRYCPNAMWCSVFDPNSYYPYWLLGMSYYFLKQKDKALGYITCAYYKNMDKDLLLLQKQIAAEVFGEWRSDLQLS